VPVWPDASGYLHRDYAASFAEIATPRELPHCGGWFLERVIPGSAFRDGMGCYPLFACHDWPRLPLDLEQLASQLISLTLVTDPFGGFTEDDLRRSFDSVLPYKRHYVTDLSIWNERAMPRSHKRNLAKSLSRVRVETCPEPFRLSNEWIHMYEHLSVRHHITGLTAFSRASLEKQLQVPGLIMFKASVNEEVVGLHLWYVQGDYGYGHLGATSVRGYESMASYALYRHAIEHMRGQVRWLDLGSVPGVSNARRHGLSLFKAGWSTGDRWAFLCGRIFQRERYATLVRERGISTTTYFPAYRLGEFTASPGTDIETGTTPC
jgi:hypothetical protein